MNCQFKVQKCYSCAKFTNDLVQMPFDKYICGECVRLKCTNELAADDDEDGSGGGGEEMSSSSCSQLDEQPISYYLDRIDLHYRHELNKRSIEEDGKHARLCRLKNKLDEFKCDFSNFAARLKRVIDVTRYQVELTYETAKARAEKRLFEKLNWIDLQAEESSKSYAANVERVTTGLETLLGQLKAVDFNNDAAQIREYERMIRRELFKFEISLGSNNIFNVKCFTHKKSSLGVLKQYVQDTLTSLLGVNSASRMSTNSVSFSVDSLLSNNQRTHQPSLKLVSILTLTQPLDGDQQVDNNMYLVFFKCPQTRACSLELFTHSGETINRIEIGDASTEIFALAPFNKSGLILCSRDDTQLVGGGGGGGFVKLSSYNCKFEVVLAKTYPMLALNRYSPLDLACECARNKLYLLLIDFHTSSHALFVFNLNLDLLNSFVLGQNVYHQSDAKLFACDDVIYMKRMKSLKSTQLSMFDSVYGRLIRSCEFDFNFSYFYVFKERLVFLSAGKYYIYDLTINSILYEYALFNSSPPKNEFINFFSLNPTDRTISSIVLSSFSPMN